MAPRTQTAAPRAKSKRSYLAKDDRHTALLDAAARVVERDGWPSLSMISVADTARVSRQLVYEHFASVDQLMTETMTHIFREVYERVREGVKRKGNLADLTVLAESSTFDLPPEKTRALWQMMTATYAQSAEIRRMSRKLRHLLTNMWMPVVRDAFDVPDLEGRVLIWMLHMAFWGGHQLVDDGEVDRDTATQLFLWMATQIQAGALLVPRKRAAKG
jgi:AcrR family transcriptional regulator